MGKSAVRSQGKFWEFHSASRMFTLNLFMNCSVLLQLSRVDSRSGMCVLVFGMTAKWYCRTKVVLYV